MRGTRVCRIALVVGALCGQLFMTAPVCPVAAAEKRPAGTVINLNTATASDFESLPGIGPKIAARIVEHRDKNGPFKKIEDLMNVRGIGEKTFLKLKQSIVVTPSASDRPGPRRGSR